ncbi:Di-copper centre-containing protein [Pholiota conissans]|uniref:Di-copper centre-containing protein n=1 Tax=Pholiota conissans TaxID=109636 RepID=A0A9P6CQJ4_9AGAR|nr:Di-copper centre-containing protein [Pholiota conissans]
MSTASKSLWLQWRLLFLVVSLALGVLASSPQSQSKRCQHPIVRKEWRTLTKKVQKEYLQAVQCILQKPALTSKAIAPGAVSRYDDLITTHILQTFSIHYVGHFLPWHRYFTAVYEQALRRECGYTGAQPYWDWTLDVPPLGEFTASPIWDATHGFGGNGPYLPLPADANPALAVPGRTGGGCVPDGPFANVTVHMGPASDLAGNPRCLSRDFSPYFAGRYLGRNVTKATLAQPDFGWFDKVVEGGPSFELSGLHGGGHYGVGGTLGEMGDLYNSPADPVFYLHHANLDRVWWSWQSKNLPTRLNDISGPIFLMDYDNLQGGNVTLAFPLSVGINAPNVTIADVMDIRSAALCYEYDHLYH